MRPKFFPSPEEFRAWLARHHASARELLVGFHKVDSGKPSLTWSQSVDEALCFGWIDGVRRTIDAESYTIRFTPRKRGSAWSAINIAKVKALERAKKMTRAGTLAFERRPREKDKSYSYERQAAVLSPAQSKRFRAAAAAWRFFRAQAPSYQRTAIHWVTSAKAEATRAARLERLVAACALGRRL